MFRLANVNKTVYHRRKQQEKYQEKHKQVYDGHSCKHADIKKNTHVNSIAFVVYYITFIFDIKH